MLFMNVKPAKFCFAAPIRNTDSLQAAHAESLGSDALLCLPELFNKPQTVDELVRYLMYVAQAAPKTPLLYYHKPSYTGVNGRYNMQGEVTIC
jgi:N-acetylneuraminate lyase